MLDDLAERLVLERERVRRRVELVAHGGGDERERVRGRLAPEAIGGRGFELLRVERDCREVGEGRKVLGRVLVEVLGVVEDSDQDSEHGAAMDHRFEDHRADRRAGELRRFRVVGVQARVGERERAACRGCVAR